MESTFFHFYPLLLVKSIFVSIGKHFLSVFIYFCQWNSYFQQVKSIFFFILFFFANYCQRKAFLYQLESIIFCFNIFLLVETIFMSNIYIFFIFYLFLLVEFIFYESEKYFFHSFANSGQRKPFSYLLESIIFFFIIFLLVGTIFMSNRYHLFFHFSSFVANGSHVSVQ